MMTKKHYVAIAAAIKSGEEARPVSATSASTQEQIAMACADYFASDNPRFDRARFLKACGVDHE